MPLPNTEPIMEAIRARKALTKKEEALTDAQRQVYLGIVELNAKAEAEEDGQEKQEQTEGEAPA